MKNCEHAEVDYRQLRDNLVQLHVSLLSPRLSLVCKRFNEGEYYFKSTQSVSQLGERACSLVLDAEQEPVSHTFPQEPSEC